MLTLFAGGALGGLASAIGGTAGVFALTLIAALVWFGIAATLRRLSHYSSYLTRIGGSGPGGIADLNSRPRSAPGVVDVVNAPDES